MSVITLHAGPFAAVYCGLASGLDTAVLTQLTGITTGAQKVTITEPEVFNYSANNTLQAGPVTITTNITFLSDDPQAVLLNTGNFLTATYLDSPSAHAKLMLLLVHPDETADSSILIPMCCVQKTNATNLEKAAATVTPVTFTWQQVNRFTPQLYYRRSLDELIAILGTRSPL